MKLTLANEFYTVTIKEKPDAWKPDDYSELHAIFDMLRGATLALGYQQESVERAFEYQAEESTTKESE
jgi:hypothetical protein